MKSKTPTWAIIVAILMMLMGGCGIKNDIQSINIRSILDMKDKILESTEVDTDHESQTKSDSLDDVPNDESVDKQKDKDVVEDTATVLAKKSVNDTISGSQPDDGSDEKKFKDIFGKLLDLPESTIVKIIRFGYIGLFFSFLLLIGGLFLLIKKSFSIKLAYAVLGANIFFSIVRWVMLSGEGGTIISLGNSLGAAFSIFTSIILLVVIISSDKSHFEETYTD